MGHNAIHDATDVLARLAAHVPEQPEVDGLRYHEGLNAVAIEGGIAGNVIPTAARSRSTTGSRRTEVNEEACCRTVTMRFWTATN